MTASTNTILIRTDDGDVEEYSGVLYAEEAHHIDDDVPCVALQYMQQHSDEKPKTEFVKHGEIIGVYDDVSDQGVTIDFLDAVSYNDDE